MFASPLRKPVQARWHAFRLDEQAVSRVILGPFKSLNQERRLESMALPVPVAIYLKFISGSRASNCIYSRVKQPT